MSRNASHALAHLFDCAVTLLVSIVLLSPTTPALAAYPSNCIVGMYEDAGSSKAVVYLTDDDSMEKNTNTTYVSHTHLGSATDATSIGNVLAALDWIEYCNEHYRKPNGLTELRVSDEAMASAERNANFSTDFFQHASDLAILYGGENLATSAMGMVTAYELWFDAEKRTWDEAVGKDPTLQDYAQDPGALFEHDPTLYAEVGHYLNIVQTSWAVTGVGLNTKELTGAVCQQFTKAAFGGTSYTVDDYRNRVYSYAPSTTTAPTHQLRRLSGATRYDTMAAIVSEGFTISSWAVLTTGANFPDALSTSALAGALGAPIVLTGPDALSSQARSTLERLHVGEVLVLGGTSALSDAVLTDLSSLGIRSTRIQGSDRTQTSLAAWRRIQELGATSDTLIIANGTNFADSLSIGPWSYATQSPLILVDRTTRLSQDAVSAIRQAPQVRRILIVGGERAVSEEVKEQLGNSYEYVRLGGTDRYGTSRLVAEWEMTQGFTWSHPGIATGTNYPDALAGAPLIGYHRSPLLLVASTSSPTALYLIDHADDVSDCYVLGGPNALSEELVKSLDKSLNGGN